MRQNTEREPDVKRRRENRNKDQQRLHREKAKEKKESEGKKMKGGTKGSKASHRRRLCLPAQISYSFPSPLQL
jgi:hypothetical protein